MEKVFIIAEAGVNHNGSFKLAKELVVKAKEAGADAVKFQTFRAEKLVSCDAEKAAYQKENTGSEESQFEMLKKLELTYAEFEKLSQFCAEQEIMFLSSPFDSESAEYLSKLGMRTFKIPSGEITNYPYLLKIADLADNIIMSTGMAYEEEIEEALKILTTFGAIKKNITVLHCNTDYPTKFKDVNLLAMNEIGRKFDVRIGYSDHTMGIEVPIAAVALGARVIEKHFTLDGNMEGPDHKASLEPHELKAMVKAVRNIEKALGTGEIAPSDREKENRNIARKVIAASKDIKQGDYLTEDNITVKRCGVGISPMKWINIIGTKAVRDFKADEAIEI